ncbi:MAG: hypothetical protein LCH76_01135 [Actinobacteria bacterium]|nr:hypothetical protein [Actinomycetota bacterium]
MTRNLTRSVLIAVSVAAMGLLAPHATVAHAAGDGECTGDGACSVKDSDPRVPSSNSDKPKPKDEDKPPKLPECGSYPDARMDVPEDADNPEDWVQVACMEGSLRLVVWVEGRATPAQVAQSLLAQVQLEPIQIGLTPKSADPMTVVGMPVWLWVAEPSRTTWGPATISAGGMTLTASVESISWDMGDGTTLTCGKGTEWQYGMGDALSPTCGHVYEKQGRYTVRARSHWLARWSGYGQSGTIPVTLSAARQLAVGEIQVILTGR